MKSFLRSRYLLIGILAGLLLGGGWFAWAAIQSQVGINVLEPTSGSWGPLINLWNGTNDNQIVLSGTGTNFILDTQTMLYAFNGVGLDRLRTTAIGDAQPSTGILGTQPFVFNGATYDRLRSFAGSGDAQAIPTGSLASSVFPFVFNGATWDRVRSALVSGTTQTTGIQQTANSFREGTDLAYTPNSSASSVADSAAGKTFGASLQTYYNGTAFDRSRSASTTNLTTSPLTGVSLTLPASNVSCTSTPATGSKATCSIAAGAGTVRHVATTLTACYADTALAVARQVNLRDGATGAGTILWSALLAVSAADVSKCVTISGLSFTGSATTAMTLEFDAAGAATSQETITLTALNVQ